MPILAIGNKWHVEGRLVAITTGAAPGEFVNTMNLLKPGRLKSVNATVTRQTISMALIGISRVRKALPLPLDYWVYGDYAEQLSIGIWQDDNVTRVVYVWVEVWVED